MYARVHARVRAGVHARVHVCSCVRLHVPPSGAASWACACMCMRMCMHVHAHVHACAWAHHDASKRRGELGELSGCEEGRVGRHEEEELGVDL